MSLGSVTAWRHLCTNDNFKWSLSEADLREVQTTFLITPCVSIILCFPLAYADVVVGQKRRMPQVVSKSRVAKFMKLWMLQHLLNLRCGNILVSLCHKKEKGEKMVDKKQYIDAAGLYTPTTLYYAYCNVQIQSLFKLEILLISLEIRQ